MSKFTFDTSLICPEDISATPERIEQYKDYYKIKYDICQEANPQKIAEIGVRAGYSAWTFLQAAPEAEFIGIDANNGEHGGAGGEDGCYMKWARKILKGYNSKFIEEDTQNLTKLDISDVDFFHIDGDHTEKGVMHDLSLALNCISPQGTILVDDIDYLAAVKEGVKKWLAENKEYVQWEYRASLRGECIIKNRKKLMVTTRRGS